MRPPPPYVPPPARPPFCPPDMLSGRCASGFGGAGGVQGAGLPPAQPRGPDSPGQGPDLRFPVQPCAGPRARGPGPPAPRLPGLPQVQGAQHGLGSLVPSGATRSSDCSFSTVSPSPAAGRAWSTRTRSAVPASRLCLATTSRRRGQGKWRTSRTQSRGRPRCVPALRGRQKAWAMKLSSA